MKQLIGKVIDTVFLLDQTSPNRGAPSWKFRRKLIFGAYRLSFCMIAFGAVTFMWDTNVSASLITGGVALMSIIIAAYVAGASYEDTKKNGKTDEILEP